MTIGQQTLRRPGPVAASKAGPQRLLFNVGVAKSGTGTSSMPAARPAIRAAGWSSLRGRVARHAAPLMGLVVPLLLLTLWQLSSVFGWLPEQILPAPGVVWQTLLDYAASGSLLSDAEISLLRVARGFSSGAAIGLALGGAMATAPRLRAYLDPLFLAISQVPILGWVPLLILLIGIDEGLKTSLVALSVFIPVTLGTYQGIRDVPSAYREVGQVLTFSRPQMLGTIILPAAGPAIFTGLREGLSNGWQTLVAVELLASTEGLGYQMAYGRQLFQLELVITAMLVIGAIGYLFDLLLGRIEGHLQRWQVAA
jgi:sulfonate transport system permease protein